MGRLRALRMAVVAAAVLLVLVACQGGGMLAPDGSPDGMVIVADARMLCLEPGGDGCNPVERLGCGSGEKCTFLVESVEPYLACTTCVPAGPITEGGACALPESGADDCAAGLYCAAGRCTEICLTLDDTNCDGDETCVRDPEAFQDIDHVGLCEPACDPVGLTAGCADGEGCYPNLTTGRSACYTPADCPESSTGAPQCATEPGTQGCNCQGINCCVPGHACALANDPVNATGLLCAFLCDASASGGPTCADGPGASYECRQINLFYDNTPNVPDAVGMCVDPTVWP